MLQVILVRHGQTLANIQHRLQGHIDGALTETGIRQADLLATHFESIEFDQVLTSDLSRAYETAIRISKSRSRPIEVDPDLREWDVGTLDGKPAEVLHQALEQSQVEITDFRPPGGESLKELRLRAESVYQDYMQRFAEKRVVIFSHGDFMRQFLGAMLQKDIESAMQQHFDNTSYTILNYCGAESWEIITLNSTSHLRKGANIN